MRLLHYAERADAACGTCQIDARAATVPASLPRVSVLTGARRSPLSPLFIELSRAQS